MRIILFLLAILLAWFVIKALLPSKKSKPQVAGNEEKMVACAYCGLHIPIGEAIRSNNDHFFCCDTHKQEWKIKQENNQD